MKSSKSRITAIALGIFIWACPLLSRAQSHALTDSLEKMLKIQKEDSTKVKLLSELSWNYSFTDIPKAKTYAGEGLKLAIELAHPRLQGEMKNMLGLLAIDENDPDKALTYFKNAAADFEKEKDKKGLTKATLNIGLAYKAKDEPRKAMDYYYRAFQLASTTGDKKTMSGCLSNIGAIYQDTKDPDSALSYHQQALQLRAELKDTTGMGISTYNIGALYSNAGKYKEAISYFTRSAALFEAINREKNLILVYNSIAGADRRMGNLKEAFKYNQLALELAQKTGVKKYLPGIYSLMGLLHFEAGNYKKSKWAYTKSMRYALAGDNLEQACQAAVGLALTARESGNYEEAANHYRQAIQYARKSGILRNQILALGGYADMKLEQKDTSGIKALLDETLHIARAMSSTDQLRKAFLAYATYETLIQQPQNAIRYYQQYAILTDSIFGQDVSEKFAEMQTRFETGKKEKEIALLKQQKQIDRLTLQKRTYQMITLIAILIILIIIVVAYLRRQQLRRRTEASLQELREKELKQKTIAETEQAERQRIAKDLHDELGSGMSKIVLSNELAKKHINGNPDLNYTLRSIDKTVQELSGNMKALIWSLNNENGTVETLLVKMREFAGDFLEESNIGPEFDFPDELPELKLSKEILRDIFLAFKEAVNNTLKYSEASKINLSAALERNNILNIRIADNGIGMQLTERLYAGSGLLNMKERIERQDGEFKINSSPGAGTEIIFRMPIPN